MRGCECDASVDAYEVFADLNVLVDASRVDVFAGYAVETEVEVFVPVATGEFSGGNILQTCLNLAINHVGEAVG